jgi:hypothetical protein
MTNLNPSYNEKLKDHDHDEASTEERSIADMNKQTENPNLNKEDLDVTKEQETGAVALDDYSHGTRLAVIIISLILSMFIVAIDQVSYYCSILMIF